MKKQIPLSSSSNKYVANIRKYKKVIYPTYEFISNNFNKCEAYLLRLKTFLIVPNSYDIDTPNCVKNWK